MDCLAAPMRQLEGKEYAASAGEDVLLAVEHVGGRRAGDVGAGTGVPQRLAVRGAKRQKIAVRVAGECEAGVGSHDACT